MAGHSVRSRAREYGLLVASSLLAGLAGASFDQLTVTISPDYFITGKGLSPANLRIEAAVLGFRSALPLGALVVGGGLLRARAATRFPWERWLGTVAACTALAPVAGALVLPLVDPFELRALLSSSLDAAATTRFLVCSGIHIGAYLGVVLGVLVAWLGLSPRRLATSACAGRISLRSYTARVELTEIEKAIRRRVRAEQNVAAVYLFGSFAKGTARPASDVDVGVLFRELPIDALSRCGASLAAELSVALRRDVDVVVMNTAPVDVVHRILSEARLLADLAPSARIAFEVRSRNEYFGRAAR